MEKSGKCPTASKSVEDFSEYADAEESISAPTELLAEFLNSVMIKDYEKALQYCTQILSYEPDNASVKEFRPLIEEKLEMSRKKELEDNSSDSSLSGSSSMSDSSESLNDIKNEICGEAVSLDCSSLECDGGSNEISGIYKTNASQSDIRNGNGKTPSPQSLSKKISKAKRDKEIRASATRTIVPAKLLAHQTQTRVLRRNSRDSQNDDISNLKNENPLRPLRSTKTRVLTKKNSLSQAATDNDSKTFAWFSSIQKKRFWQ